jgi:negative regulator of flagellin synthesis FlgM
MKILNENKNINIASYGNNIGKAPRAEQKGDHKAATTLNEEKVAISTQAKEFNEVSTAMKLVPEIREEKIALIQEQIANGTYQIDNKKIAEKIILDVLETRAIK